MDIQETERPLADSIFSSIEVDAWSRQFDYHNYTLMHGRMLCKARPLSKDAYRELGQVLHKEMEKYFETSISKK
jgi:hypothetical protein